MAIHWRSNLTLASVGGCQASHSRARPSLVVGGGIHLVCWVAIVDARAMLDEQASSLPNPQASLLHNGLDCVAWLFPAPMTLIQMFFSEAAPHGPLGTCRHLKFMPP